MKKFISLTAAAAVALTMCACGTQTPGDSGSKDSSTTTTTTAPAVSDTTTTTTEPEKEPTLFDTYVSNTSISTGNNYMIEKADGVSYRGYFQVQEKGELEYCFYFSNTCDSTYDSGDIAYVNKPTGDYKILSASVGIANDYKNGAEPTEMFTVTFDGSETRDVKGGEEFWSDPINLSVSDGEYLVWEWKIEGENIAAMAMSGIAPTFADTGDGMGFCNEVAMPNMIGAKREVKKTIAAIGDSITQGCMTGVDKYAFWVAQIETALGDDYSMWNLGLGWSRASDCAISESWLNRATYADVVIVAFGTNDINSGAYKAENPDTSEQVIENTKTIVKKLTDAGCEVILFNAPPFGFTGDKEDVRQAYNSAAKDIAEEFGCQVFDFSAPLASEAVPSSPAYGQHPNVNGCRLVRNAFIEQFADFLGYDIADYNAIISAEEEAANAA